MLDPLLRAYKYVTQLDYSPSHEFVTLRPMRLQKLVLNGFKSFAVKTVFEFGPGLTAIVGPNGSGKSNVADAVRWVLGEQSLKLIRGKKAEDVIYGGSKQLSRLGMAQVDLYIDNVDKRLPIDFTEVVISRRVYRTGESEYYINKSQVRLQDIIMLLAKANVGQKSYAVIGQGMIDGILNATPQDRKAFFDEATGVKEFQIKRDQSLNKLIRTEEHLQQAETLMAEIEPRLRSLTRQVKKLERRGQLQAEMRDAQVQLYGSEWSELHGLRAAQDKKKMEVEVEIHGIQKEIDTLSAELDKLAQAASRQDVFAELQRTQADLFHRKQKLLRDQAVLKGKIELSNEAAGKMNVVFLERKKQDNTLRLEQLASKKKSAEQLVADRSRALHDTQAIQAEELKRFKDTEYRLLKAKEELDRLSHHLSVPEVRDRLTRLFGEQEKFLKRLMATNNLEQFKTVKQEAKAITEQLAALLDDIHDEPTEQLRGKQLEIVRFEQALEQALTGRDNLVNEANRLKVDMQGAQHQVTLLQEEWQRVKEETDAVERELVLLNRDSGHAQAEVAAQVQIELDTLTATMETVDGDLGVVDKKLSDFNEAEEQKKLALVRLQHQRERWQTQLNGFRDQLAQTAVELARLDTRREDTLKEMQRELAAEDVGLAQKTEAGEVNRAAVREHIHQLKQQLEQIGGIDQEIVKEYEGTKERFEFLSGQIADLRSAIEQLEKIVDELDVTIKKQFSAAIKDIDAEFGKYFSVLFGGGSAALKLVMEEPVPEAAEPVEGTPAEGAAVATPAEQVVAPQSIGKKKKAQKIIAGVDIEANPPGKKIQSVAVLSGGEKAMTAIALLSAIIASNPPPFVVMDEVEAALDEANSEKFSHILKQLSGGTQCIVVTHNRSTMQAAHTLYGVTMGDDSRSHILSVKMEEAQKLAEQAPAANTSTN